MICGMAAASAPAIPKSVETLEQVIQKLDEIINWAWTHRAGWAILPRSTAE
jgi:hypothetical protein